MVTASLKNYRQSPRKVRVVADLVRGKKVGEALAVLAFTTKKATSPLAKLLESAVTNAKSQNISTDNLFVKEIRVDKGVVMKRFMPRARGSAAPIHKRSCHVLVTLDEKIATEKNKKTSKVISTSVKANAAKEAKKLKA